MLRPKVWTHPELFFFSLSTKKPHQQNLCDVPERSVENVIPPVPCLLLSPQSEPMSLFPGFVQQPPHYSPTSPFPIRSWSTTIFQKQKSGHGMCLPKTRPDSAQDNCSLFPSHKQAHHHLAPDTPSRRSTSRPAVQLRCAGSTRSLCPCCSLGLEFPSLALSLPIHLTPVDPSGCSSDFASSRNPS